MPIIIFLEFNYSKYQTMYVCCMIQFTNKSILMYFNPDIKYVRMLIKIPGHKQHAVLVHALLVRVEESYYLNDLSPVDDAPLLKVG